MHFFMDFIYLNTVKKIVIRLKRKITTQKETDKSTKVRFCAEFEKSIKGQFKITHKTKQVEALEQNPKILLYTTII
ncbi:hypothetical protein AS4_24040 [Acinetobacter guillouiae]|nr:hypothetical protein AS4_24040 [Acinetobacter guillouiae]